MIWSPPSLSGLTPMVFKTRLTHLGSEASIYTFRKMATRVQNINLKNLQFLIFFIKDTIKISFYWH